MGKQGSKVGRLDYDTTKIKEVPIDEVRPNTWNPKQRNEIIINYLKQSIQDIGFKQPLSVRQNDGYEILDGEQRWTAMKEMGAKKIHIYDNGQVNDEDAQSETINWQIQVPFDDIKLAPLVVKLADMGKRLPFTTQEIQDFKELANFDFNQYNTERPEFDDEVRTFNVKLTKEAYNIVIQAIEKCKQEDDMNEARAIELICADYLGS